MSDKELVGKILDASNLINDASRRGQANNIFCGKSIGDELREVFEEINREEIKKDRNKKIDDLLNGE